MRSRLKPLKKESMDYTIDRIRDVIYQLKEKIKTIEMLTCHCKATLMELDETLLDIQDRKLSEKISNLDEWYKNL